MQSNDSRTSIEHQSNAKKDVKIRLIRLTFLFDWVRLPFDSYIFHNLSLNSLKSFTSMLSWRSYNIVFITLHKNYLYVLPRIKRSTWFQYYYIFIGVMRLNVPRVFILKSCLKCIKTLKMLHSQARGWACGLSPAHYLECYLPLAGVWTAEDTYSGWLSGRSIKYALAAFPGTAHVVKLELNTEVESSGM